MRARWQVVCAAALAAWAGCGGELDSNPAPGESQAQGAASWQQLPAPPLSGRVGALVATAGDAIIVSGGWDWLCPPNADCAFPDTPPHADGAAYDLKVGTWRAISDAPVGFRFTVSATVADDVYALSQCDPGPTCPAGRALLRYRSRADGWDLLPAPEGVGGYRLVAALGGIVAFSSSDEVGRVSDYRFSAAENRWTELPDDPLPPVFDRFVMEFAGKLLVFGTPLGEPLQTKLAAAYDPETGAWQELAASGSLGYQVWRAGSLLYLNPHFGVPGGGVYDPDANRWQPLPDPPYHDLAGVIGDDEATYEYSSGWVLDTRTGAWLEIEPRPDTSDVYDEVIATAPNQGMVVFGGQTWASGDGQLVNDTWLWSPPALTR